MRQRRSASSSLSHGFGSIRVSGDHSVPTEIAGVRKSISLRRSGTGRSWTHHPQLTEEWRSCVGDLRPTCGRAMSGGVTEVQLCIPVLPLGCVDPVQRRNQKCLTEAYPIIQVRAVANVPKTVACKRRSRQAHRGVGRSQKHGVLRLYALAVLQSQ